jgi:hypothetical protein
MDKRWGTRCDSGNGERASAGPRGRRSLDLKANISPNLAEDCCDKRDQAGSVCQIAAGLGPFRQMVLCQMTDPWQAPSNKRSVVGS